MLSLSFDCVSINMILKCPHFWVPQVEARIQKGVPKIKVKESRNRPGVAQRVPGGLGSQSS
jgi:hypothetical protein